MAYQIVKHELTGTARVLSVLVNPDASEEEQVVESFAWGLDVAEESVLRETRLLLDSKYLRPVTVLPGGEL